MYFFAILGFLLCLGVISYSFIYKSRNLEKKEEKKKENRKEKKKEKKKGVGA